MHRWIVFAFLLVVVSDARRFYPLTRGSETPHQQRYTDGREVGADSWAQYNPYTKHHTGRHVCTNQKNSTHLIKTKQAGCKPIYKKYYVRCGDQLCAGVKLVYEAYDKEVVEPRSSNEITYACCPGWTQITNRSHGCNKPVCPQPCQNGGKCVKPGLCSCPRGFTGPQCASASPPTENYCPRACLNGGKCLAKGICVCTAGFQGPSCERDVDECKEHKPCDQICYNTPGSFSCQCRENFVLLKDGQTCRKENDDGTTLETKDLEFETIDKRLLKLETMMDESHKNEVTKNDVQIIYKDIDQMSSNLKDLKGKLTLLEYFKSDLSVFKNKLNQIEAKAGKIDDLLLKYDKMKKCAFYNKICI